MSEEYKYRQIRRETEAPTFLLTTDDVKKYLQVRVDIIVAELRKTDPKYAKLPDIDIDVSGSRASETYVPMMVILPPTVLEDETSSTDAGVPGIYFSRDEDSQLKMIKNIEELFKMYIFTKEDKKLYFGTMSWLREKGISAKIGATIASYTEPRYRKRNDKDGDGNSNDIIMFFIDPIRVFHEMVMLKGEDGQSYFINIEKVKKIRDGQYQYRVKKTYKSKKKHKKVSFYREMDSFLRTRN